MFYKLKCISSCFKSCDVLHFL